MNPLYQIIIGSLLQYKRKCPACKRDQIVAPSRIRDTVQCKFCGKPIPPLKSTDR